MIESVWGTILMGKSLPLSGTFANHLTFLSVVEPSYRTAGKNYTVPTSSYLTA
jgi:hypothetical protein